MENKNIKEDVTLLKPEQVIRGHWKNKREFFLSCMGYAIGIGSVVRFPYLCYRNGGGAFLIPFLLMLFLCGIPLFFMESSLGQFGGSGCIAIFDICPAFRGAGYSMIIVNLIVTMYYTPYLAYSVVFLCESFRSKMPWQDCNNEWNTPDCVNLRDFTNTRNLTNMNTPADEFFHNKLLQISDGIEHPGNPVWQILVANLFTWTVIYLCIMNGVSSVGKVVYFTAVFPYVILFILLIRGATLPGAREGIIFYIYPEWSSLTNFKTWADAAVQIFFSIGPGWGGIINMASYNQFRNNTKIDSVLVPLITGFTCIFAGFVVFSVLGYMSHESGLPIADVATTGPGLAFVTYPEAIAMMPVPQLWAILFMLMLFLLGLDSVFVQIESIVSSVGDQYPRLRKYKQLLALFWCIFMFLISISCCTNGGMYVLSLLDWYASAITIIIACLVESIIIGWIYGVKQFIMDVEFMLEKKLRCIWIYIWKFISPALLAFILITTIVFNTRIVYNDVQYPDWAIAVGWLCCGLSAIWIPVYMMYIFYITPGSFKERMKKITSPKEEWGPADPEIKKAWLLLLEERRTPVAK